MELRVGMLNVCWMATESQRLRQVDSLASSNLDLLCLLEVRAGNVPKVATATGFMWSECSVVPNVAGTHLGVAVLGKGPVRVRAVHQLPADDFLNEEVGVGPELARRFHERHLAVDVGVGPDTVLRVGVFHATPGSTKNPDGGLVRTRKPWFHTRIAEWVATWEPPYLFAVDANTPKVDVADWSMTRVWWPRARTGLAGEDSLVGAPDEVLHKARDLWRDWLASPAGAADLARVPKAGPLARSYSTKKGVGSWYRYDQVWATDDVAVADMSYDYELARSDHALVTATVEIPSASGARAMSNLGGAAGYCPRCGFEFVDHGRTQPCRALSACRRRRAEYPRGYPPRSTGAPDYRKTHGSGP
jgi:hypothetical protein